MKDVEGRKREKSERKKRGPGDIRVFPHPATAVEAILLQIGQWAACPPLSYPKNLVSQCNMAPPQSPQLAVCALFGVVS